MNLLRGCAVALLPLATAAQVPPPASVDAAQVRAFVSQQVAAGGQILTRFDVQVGNLDARTALAPCRRTEPFLPAGGRLWGRSSVGLRCVDGATWSIMVPVTVQAWGNALVATGPLAAGTVPALQDVREQEVELTREAPGLLRDPAQVQGRALTRNLLPGQALRADMLRAPQVVQAGDPVRLRIVGNGFSVSASAQALSPAAEGQPVRVRTELGKILTGVAREGRVVDVAL